MQSAQELSMAKRINAACLRFEIALQAGQKPRIEEYLSKAPRPDRASLFRALLALEIEMRRQAGEAVVADSYHARFPDRSDAISSAFAEADGRPATADTSVAHESLSTAEHDALSATAATTEPAMPKHIERFAITLLLGAGRFARVYRATDPRTRRDLAIKVLLPGAFKSAADRERFLGETRAAAALKHPNICPVHEVAEENEQPYVVMAFVPGQSLADVLKARKKPLQAKQAAVIARKLALALDAAHEKGIVHQNLSLANVLFDRDRRDVLITDFGWRQPGGPIVDASANIASLGTILLALLTISAGGMTTPSDAGIDPQLELIFRRAMTGGPAGRFRSMRELAAALDDYLTANGKKAPATPASAASVAPAPVPASSAAAAPFDDMVAAFAEAAGADAEDTIDAPVRRARVPMWRWLAAPGGALIILILTAFLVSRQATVTVQIPISNQELADRSLSFSLDGQPIAAEILAEPIELKVEEHMLIVKRGDLVVRRMRFIALKEGGGTIKITHDSGPVRSLERRS